MNAYPLTTLARRPLAEILRYEDSPPTPALSLDLSFLSSVTSLALSLPEPPPRVLTREQLNTSLFRRDPEYAYPPPSPRQPSAFATIVAQPDPEAALSFPGRIFQLTDVRHSYASPIRVGSYIQLRSGPYEGRVTIIKTWERGLEAYYVLLAEEEETQTLVLLLMKKAREREGSILGSLVTFIGSFLC
jgi:hypothetical protein